MKKIFMILAAALLTVSMSAADLTGKRIYVNPGHGSWGPNDRPMATILYPNLPTTGMPDTLGFYESTTPTFGKVCTWVRNWRPQVPQFSTLVHNLVLGHMK